ncbi:unnamed protein product [Orchesella dallaii]|uniref:DUF4789 domain-containing protein n=1 Tax=Orchesella dallaii TaxID=48710 RepID=A0ABP1QTL0_9HEXA
MISRRFSIMDGGVRRGSEIVAVFLVFLSVACAVELDKHENSTSSILEYVQKKGMELTSGGDSNQQEMDEFMMEDRSIEQLPCSDLRGYAYHNESGKCWQVGTQGPCTAMMRFYADPENEGYGDCDCPAMRNCIGRPRTFWPATSKCYFIYSKGPCKQGQWLVFNKNRKPECQANPCGAAGKLRKRGEAVTEFMFHHSGTCYKTGSRAFCEDGQTVYLSSSDFKPRCYNTKPVCRFLIFAAQTLTCRPGSKQDVMGKCDHMREMDDGVEEEDSS